MGFVLDNKLLIISGALDGASGFILSVNMSKAMNRSFWNVLFGAFGQQQASAAAGAETRAVRSASPEEAASISQQPIKLSSCPVTAWPFHKRSIRSANSTMCSPNAASTCVSASTRSSVACPAT